METLHEKHRKLAELKVRGMPLTRIAEEIGVTRQTLNDWMKFPLWQQYYEALVEDVEKARAERLVGPIENTIGLLNDLVTELRDRVETVQNMAGTDPDTVKARAALAASIPRLESIGSVVTKLVETQRLEGGRPQKHTRVDSGAAGDVPDKGAQGVLDGAFAPGSRPAAQPETKH